MPKETLPIVDIHIEFYLNEMGPQHRLEHRMPSIKWTKNENRMQTKNCYKPGKEKTIQDNVEKQHWKTHKSKDRYILFFQEAEFFETRRYSSFPGILKAYTNHDYCTDSRRYPLHCNLQGF